MNNQKSQIFDYLQIGLASPSRIRSWSRGEVKKPETINYRTLKPERDGLFCERIFGPSKDWECHCGKYKRVRHKGVVCARCGVEVTDSKVRRERMGHIDLAAPVTHIWYLKGATSYISLLLGMAARSIEEVVYFNSYSVLDPGSSDFKKGQLLSEKEYEDYQATIQEGTHTPIRVGMGAEAVKELLETLDLRKLSEELHQELKESSKQKRAKIVRRLRIVEGFISSGNNPGWMVMEVIPVIPPDLRPMVQLDGGRFATSDLNDLYRRVINRNNRLKRLKEIHAPNIIIRNEMRMLQEAVDALISNGKRGKAVVGANNRPLKSLSNIIEGKQGRFRQNLLGKRVDYSGRSVIVVGPSLKLNQCGLPKEMALELFKPFVIHNLVSKGVVQNIKSAKAMIDRNDSRIWDALAEEIKGRYVLLNRAPTLHRLGIQAFEPILVEGRAIKLHPLVCTAFNADFDGDQMAVHVPLSVEAQTEAQIIMAANHNILAPSNGRPIVTPSQDMVLGIYYLTVENPKAKKGAGMIFGNAAEVITAYEAGVVDLHATIKVRRNGEKIDTTAGRVLFNQVMPESFAYVNYIVDKKRLEELLYRCYLTLGTEASALFADQLKELGFKFATQAGVSISIEDLHVPQAKKSILNRAESEIEQARHHYLRGEITEVERYSKVIDTWAEVTEELTGYIVRDYDRLNSVYMMAFSGARGNLSQVRQLVGMRGLMADPSGRIIDMPIKSNFKEGLNVTEYIISTYGARKGIVDTALRTADSGYLTRRLVDVAQDVIVWEEDCGTTEGIELSNVREGERIIVHVADQARGRVLMENLVDTATGEVVAPAGSIVDVPLTQKIVKLGTESLKIRSVLSCRSKFGVCRQCYGWNLSNNRLVDIGEAVGIIAAQSIGEPGTQLTMRTFHTGGVFSQTSSKVSIKAKKGGTVKLPKDMITKEFRTKHGATVRTLEKGVQMSITAEDNTVEKYNVPANFQLKVANGDKVKEGTILAESLQEVGKGARKSTEKGFKDLLADFSGEVRYMGFAGNLVTDRQGNMAKTADRSGVIWILAGDIYPVIPDAKLLVKSGQEVKKGSLLAESEIACRFGGKVRFTQDIRTAEEKLSGKEKMNRLLTGKELYVEVSKLLNINGKLEIGKKASLLKVEGDKTYQLKVGHGTKVEHGMVLADAVDDSLVLHESGEIFIDNPSAVAKDRTVNEEVFLSFAPVESYSVNKDVSLLRAEHGTLVKAGQEIAKDVHSRIDGVLEVVIENYIIKEAKVWPVLEQHQIEKGENILVKNGQRIKEGTKLAGKVSSKKAGIVKVLPLGEEKGTLVLVRPVIAYSVKQEEPALKWKSSGIVFGVTARTHLLIDHGKHINTTTGGVPLARTEMILNLPGRLSDLLGQVEFVEGKDNKRSFQMVLLESVSLAKNVGLIRKALKEESESFATYLMVDAGDDVKANAVLAKSVVRSHSEGIADVSLDEEGHLKKLIVISPQMVSRFKWTKGEPAIKDGEIVREGTEVLPGVVTEEGGLVHIDAKAKTLSIRHGRPYLIKAGTHLMADEGQMVQQGEVVATLTFDKLKTGDIIQGLPRVEELLEARTPKEHAILSEHEGRVQVVQEGEIILKLSIVDDKDVEHEYKVMPRVTLLVTNGQRVTRGDALTDGVLNPHDILRITGVSAVQQYLVNEVQQVYRSQGVHINNKHVELIVRQMTKKGIVIDPGEVTFLPGELVELRDVETLTESVPEEKKPLIAPALLGITKASLMTSSFISAASFQETTRVLTEAAIEGKKDYLRGLKENVIIGRLIPAGTGLATVYAEKTIEEVAGEAAAEVEAAGAEEAALARVGDGDLS